MDRRSFFFTLSIFSFLLSGHSDVSASLSSLMPGDALPRLAGQALGGSGSISH